MFKIVKSIDIDYWWKPTDLNSAYMFQIGIEIMVINFREEPSRLISDITLSIS